MADYIDWRGESGQLYRYWVLATVRPEGILAAGGNYGFFKTVPSGDLSPLYFGEAKDLKVRISGHELLPEAVKLGCTHVMAHTTPAGEQARLVEEKDLIRFWNPPLNIQHRKTAS